MKNFRLIRKSTTEAISRSNKIFYRPLPSRNFSFRSAGNLLDSKPLTLSLPEARHAGRHAISVLLPHSCSAALLQDAPPRLGVSELKSDRDGYPTSVRPFATRGVSAPTRLCALPRRNAPCENPSAFSTPPTDTCTDRRCAELRRHRACADARFPPAADLRTDAPGWHQRRGTTSNER